MAGKKGTKATTKTAASKKSKKQKVYGIDDMVDAVQADIESDANAPASAKGLTKKAIKAVLQSEQALHIGIVANGDKVAYIGYGTLEQRARSARKGRNPQTGEEIDIPATVVPGFKPGKLFKDSVKPQ